MLGGLPDRSDGRLDRFDRVLDGARRVLARALDGLCVVAAFASGGHGGSDVAGESLDDVHERAEDVTFGCLLGALQRADRALVSGDEAESGCVFRDGQGSSCG